jgi:hypothetical protein
MPRIIKIRPANDNVAINRRYTVPESIALELAFEQFGASLEDDAIGRPTIINGRSVQAITSLDTYLKTSGHWSRDDG